MNKLFEENIFILNGCNREIFIEWLESFIKKKSFLFSIDRKLGQFMASDDLLCIIFT